MWMRSPRSLRPRAVSAGLAILLVAASPGLYRQAAGQETEAEPRAGAPRTVTIPGTEIDFVMVFVPGGELVLGAPEGTEGREPDEAPARRVRLSPFWVGAHEVTYEEFEIFRYRGLDDHVAAVPEIAFDADAVSRPSPPYEDPGHGGGQGTHPAVGMTRRGAMAYARWLSAKTGRLYRLPTEAEWEYVCRAGGTAAYTFGVEPATAAEHAWVEGVAGGGHHPVGQLEPNPWGVFDLHGNVAEWVLDTYSDSAYAALPADGPALDPVHGEPPSGRGLVRGGGYDDPLVRCGDRLPELAAWKRRDPQIPKSRWWNTDSPHVGFRLVSPDREHSLEEIEAYWERLLGPR